MSGSNQQRPTPGTRDDYAVYYPVTTRWADNDAYGHVNNVAFYAFFDTAVNRFLVEAGGLDIHAGPVIGYVVRSGCDYHAPVAYPQDLEVGVRVDRLGGSSVTYGVGVFAADSASAAADGHFVHVFVDRGSGRPTPIPGAIRDALATLCPDVRERSPGTK